MSVEADDDLLARFHEDGYTVIEHAVGAEVVAAVRSELQPWLGSSAPQGRNGSASRRAVISTRPQF
jgi:hypothetical protein